MLIEDHGPMMTLWHSCEGLGMTGADSREGIASFLQRNPGFSFVAESDGELIGTALCGHDGRRGFIYHLAVAAAQRRQGIARRLVEACLAQLKAAGLPRCHIVVYANNHEGRNFWRKLGWFDRDELRLMSFNLA